MSRIVFLPTPRSLLQPDGALRSEGWDPRPTFSLCHSSSALGVPCIAPFLTPRWDAVLHERG